MITRHQIGPRMSQAVTCNGTVYRAGQVADDPKAGPNAGIEQQTREVLAKVDALLAAAGTSRSRPLMVSVFLSDMRDFNAMNRIDDGWIDPANPPARACVEARLASPDLRVEVVAVAAP